VSTSSIFHDSNIFLINRTCLAQLGNTIRSSSSNGNTCACVHDVVEESFRCTLHDIWQSFMCRVYRARQYRRMSFACSIVFNCVLSHSPRSLLCNWTLIVLLWRSLRSGYPLTSPSGDRRSALVANSDSPLFLQIICSLFK
jgi:hypothetical protein